MSIALNMKSIPRWKRLAGYEGDREEGAAMKEKESTQFHVTLSGMGGQGVLISGEVLAETGMKQYRTVQFFPPPISLVRGGELECTVTFSDGEIAALGAEHPEAGIIMGSLALEALGKRVVEGGILIVDTSLVSKKVARDDVTVYYIPASETALKLGSHRASNMLMLGAFVEASGVLSLDNLEQTVEERLSGGRGESLIPLNKEAVREGARFVANYGK
jgi:2-oxoglutarate ferredoxin oxidoreductase subunit gamma